MCELPPFFLAQMLEISAPCLHFSLTTLRAFREVSQALQPQPSPLVFPTAVMDTLPAGLL